MLFTLLQVTFMLFVSNLNPICFISFLCSCLQKFKIRLVLQLLYLRAPLFRFLPNGNGVRELTSLKSRAPLDYGL